MTSKSGRATIRERPCCVNRKAFLSCLGQGRWGSSLSLAFVSKHHESNGDLTLLAIFMIIYIQHEVLLIVQTKFGSYGQSGRRFTLSQNPYDMIYDILPFFIWESAGLFFKPAFVNHHNMGASC